MNTEDINKNTSELKELVFNYVSKVFEIKKKDIKIDLNFSKETWKLDVEARSLFNKFFKGNSPEEVMEKCKNHYENLLKIDEEESVTRWINFLAGNKEKDLGCDRNSCYTICYLLDEENARDYHLKMHKNLVQKYENVILSKLDPGSAYYYTLDDCNRKRFVKAEGVIAKSAKWATKYAINILDGRFYAAEENIAKKPKSACKYAIYVINAYDRMWDKCRGRDRFGWMSNDTERFIEGEPSILQDPQAAYDYAYYIMRGGWTEADDVIAEREDLAIAYVENVLKQRGNYERDERPRFHNIIRYYGDSEEVEKVYQEVKDLKLSDKLMAVIEKRFDSHPNSKR
jgi:hypothetical protein